MHESAFSIGSDRELTDTLQIGLHWFPERGGGLDRMYAELVGALPGRGVRCRGLVVGSERVAAESGGTVRAVATPGDSVVQRMRRMKTAVRFELENHRPTAVVSHFALYTAPVVRMIKQAGLPLIVHFQGPWADESRAEGAGRLSAAIKGRVEGMVYCRARRLIVLSDAFGRLLANRYDVPSELIRTIKPGVEMRRFNNGLDRRAARERLGWPTDRPIVLAVRRLVQRMGLEGLLDAVFAVKRDVPGVLVMIAGKGPLMETLLRRIKSLGVERHVRLLGFLPDDDLPAAYAAADLTIVPTVALEGFGLIVVESLASGTPVLVTPVGGLPEAVRGLSANLIMPGSDVASITRSLSSALTGKLKLPSAMECSSFATANYDWSVIAPQIRAVYEEAIDEHKL